MPESRFTLEYSIDRWSRAQSEAPASTYGNANLDIVSDKPSEAPLKPLKTPCYRCKHFLGSESGKCNAFRNRIIPEAIWSGKFTHLEPFPGDNGIRFEVNIPAEFLTISEAARVLKVNPKTIYRAVWSNKIPAYRVGKSVRISKKDIELFRK